MCKFLTPKNAACILIGVTAVVAVLGALWWALFALKPYKLSPQQLQARYDHTTPASQAGPLQVGTVEKVTMGRTTAWAQPLRYQSFDGAPVLGRILHPVDPSGSSAAAEKRPVLLALHAMGRTHWRWWDGNFKGRPTVESTHLLAERALQAGYVVMAIDARLHGDRKNPEAPLVARKLLRDLHYWGKREPYERLIIDTVKDYRVLLDALAQQPRFDTERVRAAGYSMGGQMALLLAATDARVRSVAAMVPPHLDAKVAAVAPLSFVSRLSEVEVWLITADGDEHASASQNATLFEALPGQGKRHLTFAGGHVLPPAYVDGLQPWLR